MDCRLPSSDSVLLIQLQEGSLEALGQLYDRHQRVVYRTALAITGDPDSAADLLQDVFLRLHRFAERIDPQRPLEPWLYRVTTNLSYTWVKRRQRWFRPLEGLTEWLVGNRKESPSEQLDVQDAWSQVNWAMQSLPLSQRIVIALYYVDDLSLQEISEVLEIPVGTVKSRLHYGRRALKEYLGLSASDKLSAIQYEFT